MDSTQQKRNDMSKLIVGLVSLAIAAILFLVASIPELAYYSIILPLASVGFIIAGVILILLWMLNSGEVIGRPGGIEDIRRRAALLEEEDEE